MAQKQFNKRQSRSQSVKGATNLSKETRLLKSKLDRLFDSYHQTVVATSQSQNTQMESLKIENQQLRTQLNELETETLQQFSELEDCAELLAALDEQRLASEKEAFLWKGECEKLAKEVIFLKEIIDEHHNQRTSILPEWRFRNEKTVESLFKKPESNLDKKQIECSTNKENRIGMIACFSRRESSEHRSDDEICPSLIAARRIFGNEIPASFLNTDRHCDNRSSQPDRNKKSNETFRRHSFHSMTLRSRQVGVNSQL